MNYHHLYYFWRVANGGTLTRTARMLHVSQSALSAQIRQLEDSVGTVLFERSGRRLLLTAAGQRVMAYATDIFTKGEELEALLRNGLEPGRQILRIGVLTTMSRNFIEDFIAPLLNLPDLRFILYARSMADLYAGLRSHLFDLVLTNSSAMEYDPGLSLQSQLLARQSLSIIGPARHRPPSGFPRGYETARWVLPARHTEIRMAFEGFCALADYQPDVVAESDDMAMLRLLARDSGALAVLPAVVVRDELRAGVLVEYMRLPDIYENFHMLTMARAFRPPALDALLKPWQGHTEQGERLQTSPSEGVLSRTRS